MRQANARLRRSIGILTGAGLALSVVLGLLAASPAHGARVLRLGHIMGAKHQVHLTALKFAEGVKARTSGALEVQVFPAGQLGQEKEMFESMRLGSLEMGFIAGNAVENFEPSAGLFSLPYLFGSYQHVFQVQDGAVGQEIARRVLAKTGVRYLGYGNIGFRNTLTKSRIIRTPDDFRGLKLRVPPSPAFVAAFKLLGANPTPIPGGEMYTALQTGVVDGVEGTPDILEDFKMFEVAKHYTLTRHIYTDIPLVIADSAWKSLSPVEQKALQDAAIEAGSFERELVQKIEGETFTRIKKDKVLIYEMDTAPLRTSVRSYYDEFAKRIGGARLIEEAITTK